jgi:NitT/TauT family transport system ATP-binding protein
VNDQAPLIQLRDISFAYGARRVLDRFSAAVAAGELLVVLGPSGCGKTTLLKIAASLLPPLSGEVLFRGEPALAPGPDRILVFQDTSQLLPWKTARKNIEFGLKSTGRSPREARQRATLALQEVELADEGSRYPHELSGGMRQRVAIARAFALDAPVLLLDEPFAAVDAPTRRRLGDVLRRLQDRHRPGVVFVTHDVEEALNLGDRLLVLSRTGRVLEELRPETRRHADADAPAGWSHSSRRAEVTAHINALLDLP